VTCTRGPTFGWHAAFFSDRGYEGFFEAVWEEGDRNQRTRAELERILAGSGAEQLMRAILG
jgi:hypothetical protein